MIRAVRDPSPAREERARREYDDLASRWGVEPALERLLGDRFRSKVASG
jgi:hypothetical protein